MRYRKNPADSFPLMKVALFGGAGWLAWKYILPQFAAPAAAPAVTPPAGAATGNSGGGGGAAPPAPPAPPAVTPPAPPPPSSSYNTLAALFDRMTKAASAAGITTQSPDQWDYLMQSQGGPAAPDPIEVFGGRPSMTLAQYWAGMSDYLARVKGMTGFGIYAGLGRLAFRGAR